MLVVALIVGILLGYLLSRGRIKLLKSRLETQNNLLKAKDDQLLDTLDGDDVVNGWQIKAVTFDAQVETGKNKGKKVKGLRYILIRGEERVDVPYGGSAGIGLGEPGFGFHQKEYRKHAEVVANSLA